MESLPPELLHMIIDLVEKDVECDLPNSEPTVFQDLKSLRLTCKTLAVIVEPSIFKKVLVGLFDKSLTNFVQLSKHPTISKVVKQVCFVGDVLPELKTRQEWEEDIDLRPVSWEFTEKYIAERLPGLPSYNILQSSWKDLKPKDSHDFEALRLEADAAHQALPRHKLTTKQLRHHWARYKEYRQQQVAWGPAEDRKFIKAFARLPNLFHAYNALSDLCGDVMNPPLPSVRKDILSFEAEAKHDDLWMQNPIHMKHAQCLLRAVSYRALHMKPGYTPITEMNFNNYGEQAFTSSQPIPGHASPLNTARLTFDGFEHLTLLDLDISHLLPDEDELNFIGQSQEGARQALDRGQCLVADLKAMLSRLAKIEELRLRLYPAGSGNLHLSDSSRDMLGKLEPLHYPDLKIFSLSTTATRETLLGFLGRHSKTLRDLELEACDLIGETPCWESVISQFPKLLKLDKISLIDLAESGGEPLFGYFDKTSRELVERWVLNGGKLVPPMTREELEQTYGDSTDIDVVANLVEGELPEMNVHTFMPAPGGDNDDDDDDDEDEDWNSDDLDWDELNAPGNGGSL